MTFEVLELNIKGILKTDSDALLSLQMIYRLRMFRFGTTQTHTSFIGLTTTNLARTSQKSLLKI